jgi:hypothetical protein
LSRLTLRRWELMKNLFTRGFTQVDILGAIFEVSRNKQH